MALDQEAKNLATAIRQVETGNRPVSGATGELRSRYQFLPATWKSWAKEVLGDENAPLTLENENEVAYTKIKQWKDGGLGPDQIAAKWNSGSPEWEGKVDVNPTYNVPYDVPAYVGKVKKAYGELKGQEPTAAPTAMQTPLPAAAQTPAAPAEDVSRARDIETARRYGSTLTPRGASDSIAGQTATAAANLPGSALRFGIGAVKALDPRQMAAHAEEFGRGFGEASPGGFWSDLAAVGRALPSAARETLVPEAALKLGEAGIGYAKGETSEADEALRQAQRTLVADPFGQAAPFALMAKPGAKALGVEPALVDIAMSRAAAPVTRAASRVSSGIGRTVSSTAGFAARQMTGLKREAMAEAVAQPGAFTRRGLEGATREALGAEVEQAAATARKAAGVTPEAVLGKVEKGFYERGRPTEMRLVTGRAVQSALDRRIATLDETGKAYQPIRESGTTARVNVRWLDDIVKDEGIGNLTVKNGQVRATGASKLRQPQDIRAVQSLYEFWRPTFEKGLLTADEFLNFRSDLARLSKFERDIGVSKPLEAWSRQVRYRLNEGYRSRFKGMKALDDSFESQSVALRRLRENLFDRDGRLTDAGLDRLSRAKLDNPRLMAQLEELVPGVGEQVRALQRELALRQGLVNEYGQLIDTGRRKVLGAEPVTQRRLLDDLEEVSPGIAKDLKVLNELRSLEKGLIDESGNVTDPGMQRIVNATTGAHPNLLARLEKLSPGISKRIRLYRAAQDIEAASGQKVAVYTRAAVLGGAFVASGPLAAVITAVITAPGTAVAVLRGYGMLKNAPAVRQVVNTLKRAAIEGGNAATRSPGATAAAGIGGAAIRTEEGKKSNFGKP